jgi:hypothetical protein
LDSNPDPKAKDNNIGLLRMKEVHFMISAGGRRRVGRGTIRLTLFSLQKISSSEISFTKDAFSTMKMLFLL